MNRKLYNSVSEIERIPSNILVFGSNTQGRHGKGLALLAKEEFGAVYGNPKGLQGFSFAIITKDLTKSSHPSISKQYIINQIYRLYEFAQQHKELDFYIPYNSDNNNLNSYSSEDMCIFFKLGGHEKISKIPKNIIFLKDFYDIILKIEKEDRKCICQVCKELF